MQVAPILNLQSPEKRCGKTTLLSLLSKLVRQPLPASSISAAAIFRVIEECKPTLLIDEADAFLNENEEARGIINSGHTRDAAFVIRVEGDAHEPRRFSTWGFKAISGIGRRAATIEDRSIAIKLKRKAGNEKVARLRHEPKETFDEIVRKLARFSQDNVLAVLRARPELPDTLNDRAQDNWEPLLAIAEIAGGDWKLKATQAALALSGADADVPSHGAMLLADIRTIFAARGCKEISSADLVAALVAVPDRPWRECNHGKALTQNQLSRWLKPFEIATRKVGPEHKRVSGYSAESFADAFNRYIPPSATGQPNSSSKINDLDENESGQPKNSCPDENSPNQLKLKELSGCPLSNPQTGDLRQRTFL
jgi:putative DNA primase/helicase